MRILISGIGGPTGLAMAKSLLLKYDRSELTLIGIEGGKLAPGLYNKELFDRTYLVPHSHDDNYWNVIEKIVKEEQIDHAYIVPETEVLIWSKRQIDRGLPCEALIAHYDVATVFYDKYKTFDLLKDTGVVPESIQLDVNTDIEEIGKQLGYPYWIRGGSGAGAIGAFKIQEINDLKNWLNINPKITDFLASVFLPGRNYACKLLFINDQLLRSACGERIDYLMSNAAPSGISGMCARGALINNDDLIEKSEAAIRKIFGHFNLPVHGMFTVDFKEDKDGNAKITEINIRHVSFTHAFSMAGANFVADTLQVHKDENFKKDYKKYTFDEPYTFIRGVDSDLFIIKDSELKEVYQ